MMIANIPAVYFGRGGGAQVPLHLVRRIAAAIFVRAGRCRRARYRRAAFKPSRLRARCSALDAGLDDHRFAMLERDRQAAPRAARSHRCRTPRPASHAAPPRPRRRRSPAARGPRCWRPAAVPRGTGARAGAAASSTDRAPPVKARGHARPFGRRQCIGRWVPSSASFTAATSALPVRELRIAVGERADFARASRSSSADARRFPAAPRPSGCGCAARRALALRARARLRERRARQRSACCSNAASAAARHRSGSS